MRRSALFLAALLLAAGDLNAQQYDPSLYREMRWRMIGPHRASRTKEGMAKSGVPMNTRRTV